MQQKSIKRKQEERLYKKICDELDNEEAECFFCGLPIYGRAEHHHLKGRTGENYLDKNLLVRAHSICHFNWHNQPKSKLVNFWWWDGFSKRFEERTGEPVISILKAI